MSSPSTSEPIKEQPVITFDADSVQKPARGIRRLSICIGLLLCALPAILILTPWRQNVAAKGRVIAESPLDRIQRIPAPVSGRLVKLNVTEGSRVKEGDILAELADLDPQLQMRLESQVRFAEQKLTAAGEGRDFYERQVESLVASREMSITVATFELDMADQKVLAAEQAIASAEAKRTQKNADVIRQEKLFVSGVRSELDAQKARAEARSAIAKVESEKAKLEEARKSVAAKQASIGKVRNTTQAKVESVRSSREEAITKVAIAEKDLQDARSKLERQRTQVVRAPRSGVILKIHGAGRSNLVKAGDPLLDLIPSTEGLAIELYLSGNDAPLVSPGSPVRIHFEGWPAVQFVGWPSIAQGTFGGLVSLVDSQDDGEGRFRIMVTPDPDDIPWPEQPFLRQGGRAKGWVLLEEVRLGYEIWRQLNGFPPALRKSPEKKGEDKK
ncbi:MAG: adhesin transport system membrane fusion protein [Planctomycetota bacterium]|jgi:adhesin transport system membrane fusion protein